jgi:two-component system cell cycle sensor histidine kinase/response regulator CckA
VADGWERPFPEMEGDEWVLLSVRDTGTGIPEDVLKHIFEPFYTTRAPMGSGLGLSQVDGIVRQLDGSIDVQTEVGVGTTFTLYLPAIPVLISETAVAAQDDLVSGQNETILLVEDDPHIRDSLRMTLESLNYSVLTAVNGRKALQVYQQNAPQIDLVLTDLVMPEMGGEELLTTLKQTYPSLKAVVLSGYPLSERIVGSHLFEDFVIYQKPITLEKLSQVVAQALQAQPEK